MTGIEVKLRMTQEMRDRVDAYAEKNSINRNTALKLLINRALRDEEQAERDTR